MTRLKFKKRVENSNDQTYYRSEGKKLDLPAEIVDMILEYVWKKIDSTSIIDASHKSAHLRYDDTKPSPNTSLLTCAQICHSFRQSALKILWKSIKINTSADVKMYHDFIRNTPSFKEIYGQWVQNIVINAKWAVKSNGMRHATYTHNAIKNLIHPNVKEIKLRKEQERDGMCREDDSSVGDFNDDGLTVEVYSILDEETRLSSFAFMEESLNCIFKVVPYLNDLTWDFLLFPLYPSMSAIIEHQCLFLKSFTAFKDTSFEFDAKKCYIPGLKRGLETLRLINSSRNEDCSCWNHEDRFLSENHWEEEYTHCHDCDCNERFPNNWFNIILEKGSKHCLQNVCFPEHFEANENFPFLFLFNVERKNNEDWNESTNQILKQFRSRLLQPSDRKSEPGWLFEMLKEMYDNGEFQGTPLGKALYLNRFSKDEDLTLRINENYKKYQEIDLEEFGISYQKIEKYLDQKIASLKNATVS